MINKLKIGLLIAVFLLAGAGSVAFAVSALTFSVASQVTLGAHTYTIMPGSEATSMEVATNGLSMDVVVPTGSNFVLVSPNRDTLTTTGGTVVCTNSESTLTIAGLDATTRTITPSTTACGAITGGGGGYVAPSGGGGGGGSYTPVPTPAAPVVVPGCDNRTTGFSTSTGVSCVGNTSTTPAASTLVMIPGCENRATGFSTSSGVSCVGNMYTASSSYNFGTVTLRNGSRGEAVMELQRFLNAKLNLGLVIDGKLGPKTIAVIKKWQKDNGLVSDGLVGPKTKAMMHAQAN